MGADAIPANAGDAALDKRSLFERIAAALRTAAAQRPFVAVIDDAHWADTVTLELLHFLIGALESARVLIVVAYRGDEISESLGALLARAARARNVQRVELQPLSHAHIRELIDATLPRHVEIPAESLRGIRDRSEGNPLYAEEFLKAVVDDERFGEPRQTLPASLRGLLQERLRRLDHRDVRLLEVAALIGRRFSAAFLARIGERDLPTLQPFLRMAVDEHFLVEDASEPGWFTFRHGLTRDAILDRILAMQARAMHLEIARQLEREPDRSDRIVELAEHYWRAAAFPECAVNAEPAGDLARGRHAYAEAAESYERALACGASDQRRLVALHEKAALAYGSLGDPRKVLEHLQVAVDYYTATGETERLIGAYVEMSMALRRAGETERESAVLRHAAELSARIGNGALLVKSTALLALAHAIAEEWSELEADLRAADPVLARADAPDEVRLLTARAFLNLAKDELDAWQRDFEDAAGIARMHGDPRLLAFVLTSFAVGARKLARFTVALDAFREAAATGGSSGPAYLVTFARLGHANVLYLTGALTASRAEMLDVLADEHPSTTLHILIAQFGLALAIALRDEPLAERCYAPDLLGAAFATNEPIQYAPLAAVVAEHHLARGEDEAAVALLERMLDAVPEGWSDCEALLPVAVCCSQDAITRARRHFEAAASARNPFADAYRELFEAYAAARFGERDAKMRHAKAAADLLRRLGMPLLEAEAHELAEQPGRAVALCETIGAQRFAAPDRAAPEAALDRDPADAARARDRRRRPPRILERCDRRRPLAQRADRRGSSRRRVPEAGRPVARRADQGVATGRGVSLMICSVLIPGLTFAGGN